MLAFKYCEYGFKAHNITTAVLLRHPLLECRLFVTTGGCKLWCLTSTTDDPVQDGCRCCIVPCLACAGNNEVCQAHTQQVGDGHSQPASCTSTHQQQTSVSTMELLLAASAAQCASPMRTNDCETCATQGQADNTDNIMHVQCHHTSQVSVCLCVNTAAFSPKPGSPAAGLNSYHAVRNGKLPNDSHGKRKLPTSTTLTWCHKQFQHKPVSICSVMDGSAALLKVHTEKNMACILRCHVACLPCAPLGRPVCSFPGPCLATSTVYTVAMVCLSHTMTPQAWHTSRCEQRQVVCALTR